jgi:hypothetical protein
LPCPCSVFNVSGGRIFSLVSAWGNLGVFMLSGINLLSFVVGHHMCWGSEICSVSNFSVTMLLYWTECFVNPTEKEQQSLLTTFFIYWANRVHGWWMPSSGMLRRVALVRADVSEERSASNLKYHRVHGYSGLLLAHCTGPGG